MEEKYQLKEGCLTIQMPKELDHHDNMSDGLSLIFGKQSLWTVPGSV